MSTANRWLTGVLVLLLVLAVLGGALAWRTRGDRADARVSQERYGDVLAAADREVTAFVNLRYDDPFLVCADFASYLAAQEQVGAAWLDKDAWTKMSILNTARSGKFSSDRAIAEYCDEIWNVWPLSVTM